ncbi:chorismate lyase [Thorsellia kenyensis]|uniref:Chorismate pyruvate-lyase n=1 Tax=Thorsellia kenyensis TaxID=1549888 RepID=A0ABV6CHV4_9GAMM
MTDIDNAFFQERLAAAEYFSIDQFAGREEFEKVKSWLLEMGSLTKRFEQATASVKIVPHVEHFITVKSDVQHFLEAEASIFWQRDITLYGNDMPWLIARTLVPKKALLDDYHKLVDLGTVPLGRYLFSHPTLQRTQFEIAEISIKINELSKDLFQKLFRNESTIHPYQASHKSIHLWARRSILQINDSKLLLSELFLPISPIGFNFY